MQRNTPNSMKIHMQRKLAIPILQAYKCTIEIILFFYDIIIAIFKINSTLHVVHLKQGKNQVACIVLKCIIKKVNHKLYPIFIVLVSLLEMCYFSGVQYHTNIRKFMNTIQKTMVGLTLSSCKRLTLHNAHPVAVVWGLKE